MIQFIAKRNAESPEVCKIVIVCKGIIFEAVPALLLQMMPKLWSDVMAHVEPGESREFYGLFADRIVWSKAEEGHTELDLHLSGVDDVDAGTIGTL